EYHPTVLSLSSIPQNGGWRPPVRAFPLQHLAGSPGIVVRDLKGCLEGPPDPVSTHRFPAAARASPAASRLAGKGDSCARMDTSPTVQTNRLCRKRAGLRIRIDRR